MKKRIAHIGSNLDIDVEILTSTRLLIQSNSGGGKSYAIRKLLEETHGIIQHIVLDIEGDFSSLREKLDYVLAGKDGDIEADPESAGILAHKILELKADLIVDLYELRQHDRIIFLKEFLEAMINAPKKLWHPVLIIIDEAHIFCPEKGKAESKNAVIDLCTRGRKRGFCPVLATQRISKLHKDAAAECNNKLIGRTGLDIDVKRSGEELGLPLNRETTDKLRNLQPGEFYVFGPAISREVKTGRIGAVKTTHARAGQTKFGHKPPASAKIKQKLENLAELQAQAEDELVTIDALQKERRELKATIRSLETKISSAAPKMDQTKLKEATDRIKKSFEIDLNSKLQRTARDMRDAVDGVLRGLGKAGAKLEHVPAAVTRGPVVVADRPAPSRDKYDGGPTDENLGACERKIIGFLKTRPDKHFSKVQIGAMTGYAHGSGGFNNALSRLKKLGFILASNGHIQITDKAPEVPEVPHKLSDWVNKLGACERAIYNTLLEQPIAILSKEDLAKTTNYAVNSGGFNNSLSRLKTLGLIEKNHQGFFINSQVVEAAGLA